MKTDSILTKREAQVAELCVKGYIGKEIADKLNTSYRTVVNHFQNIYDKTGIRRSTNALVSWWFCVNFSIDISETAKQIIAGGILSDGSSSRDFHSRHTAALFP